MGTNYYFYKKNEPGDAIRSHIGKASGGNTFVFHAIPDLNLFTIKDWYQFLKYHRGIILDECGQVSSLREIFTLVTTSSKVPLCKNNMYRDPYGHAFRLGDFS